MRPLTDEQKLGRRCGQCIHFHKCSTEVRTLTTVKSWTPACADHAFKGEQRNG